MLYNTVARNVLFFYICNCINCLSFRTATHLHIFIANTYMQMGKIILSITRLRVFRTKIWMLNVDLTKYKHSKLDSTLVFWFHFKIMILSHYNRLAFYLRYLPFFLTSLTFNKSMMVKCSKLLNAYSVMYIYIYICTFLKKSQTDLIFVFFHLNNITFLFVLFFFFLFWKAWECVWNGNELKIIAVSYPCEIKCMYNVHIKTKTRR